MPVREIRSGDGSQLVLEREEPRRVRLSRAKGWRMPPNTVKVDRTTRWGNPFKPSETRTAREAVDMFLEALMVPGASGLPRLRFTRDDVKRELAGRNLACWCKDGSPCHATVLLAVANL